MITINIILYNINNNEIPPDLKLLTSLSVFVTYLLIKRIFKYNIYYKKKKKKNSTNDNEKPSSICFRPLIVMLFFNFKNVRSMTYFLS